MTQHIRDAKDGMVALMTDDDWARIIWYLRVLDPECTEVNSPESALENLNAFIDRLRHVGSANIYIASMNNMRISTGNEDYRSENPILAMAYSMGSIDSILIFVARVLVPQIRAYMDDKAPTLKTVH